MARPLVVPILLRRLAFRTDRVHRELGPHAHLPSDRREANELDQVLVTPVLHHEMAEERMVAAEDRHAGTYKFDPSRLFGEERLAM